MFISQFKRLESHSFSLQSRDSVLAVTRPSGPNVDRKALGRLSMQSSLLMADFSLFIFSGRVPMHVASRRGRTSNPFYLAAEHAVLSPGCSRNREHVSI